MKPVEKNTKNSKESLHVRKQENRKRISEGCLKGHYQRPNAEKAKERTDHTEKRSRGLCIEISKSNTVVLYGRKKE